MSTDLPDPLVRYLEQRDADRTAAVAATLARLTDRERALVKDAAVMGYVLGTQHPRDEPVPRDSTMVAEVVGACLADPDLFPDLGAPDDQQDGPAEPRHDTQDATPEAHATTETNETQNDPQRGAQPCERHPNAPRIGDQCGACTIRPEPPSRRERVAAALDRLVLSWQHNQDALTAADAALNALAEPTAHCSCGQTTRLLAIDAAGAHIHADAPDRRAEVADAVTAETKRLLTRRTTTLRNRAERAEARAEQAEAALQGVRSMAQAWLRVMPPTVATKTAANAVLQRTAEYAHLDGTDTPEEH